MKHSHRTHELAHASWFLPLPLLNVSDWHKRRWLGVGPRRMRVLCPPALFRVDSALFPSFNMRHLLPDTLSTQNRGFASRWRYSVETWGSIKTISTLYWECCRHSLGWWGEPLSWAVHASALPESHYRIQVNSFVNGQPWVQSNDFHATIFDDSQSTRLLSTGFQQVICRVTTYRGWFFGCSCWQWYRIYAEELWGLSASGVLTQNWAYERRTRTWRDVHINSLAVAHYTWRVSNRWRKTEGIDSVIFLEFHDKLDFLMPPEKS